MRPRFSLPGSNFRIITLAALALLTIGGSVVTFDSAPDAQAGAASTVPDESDSGEPDADPDAGDDVSQVTTTLSPSDDSDLDTSTDSTSLEAGAGDDLGPETSAAIDRNDGATDGLGLGVPEAVDGDDAAASACTPADIAEPTDIAEPSGVAEPSSVASSDGAIPTAPTDAWFFDDFAAGDDAWTPLSGTWTNLDGAYVQSASDGYDFIAQLDRDLPASYQISVDMQAVDTALGGGIVIGQPAVGSRRGATLIDFTDGGNFLRWGAYDAESDQYRYAGGVTTGTDFDPTAIHRLSVEVRADRTRVTLDGRSMGDFDPIESGRSGLATSLSAVSFDNIEIVEL